MNLRSRRNRNLYQDEEGAPAHPGVREQLLVTGDVGPVEGNNWNDRFWGVCRGKGENQLGKILMKVRSELAKG